MADSEKEILIKLQAQVDNAVKGFETVSKSLDNIDKTTKKTQISVDNLAKGFDSFADGLGINIAKFTSLVGIMTILGETVKKSIELSIESEKVWAATEDAVRNAGYAFEDVKDIIDEVDNKNLELGIDDEDTVANIGKLVTRLDDLNDALLVNDIATKITANGIGTLESNSQNVIKALNGNIKVLKGYGIYLDETATKQDALNAFTEKFGANASASSKTLNTEVAKALNDLENNLQILGDSMRTLTGLAVKGFTFVKEGAEELIKKSGNWFGEFLEKHVEGFAQLREENRKSQEPLVFQGPVKPVKLSNGDDPLKPPKEGPSEAQKALERGKNAYEDYAKKIKDNTTKVIDNLANLEDSFQEKMKDIAESIDKAKTSMRELEEEFSKSSQENTAGVADKIIEQQEKRLELEKEISKETDRSSRLKLQEELDKVNKGLNDAQVFVSQNQGAITEAQRQNGLSDLALTIETYEKKKAASQGEYEKKRQDIQNQINDYQNQQFAEINLYTQKKNQIESLQAKALEEFDKFSKSRQKLIEEEVKKEVEAFQILLEQINRVNSAKGVFSPILKELGNTTNNNNNQKSTVVNIGTYNNGGGGVNNNQLLDRNIVNI